MDANGAWAWDGCWVVEASFGIFLLLSSSCACACRNCSISISFCLSISCRTIRFGRKRDSPCCNVMNSFGFIPFLFRASDKRAEDERGPDKGSEERINVPKCEPTLCTDRNSWWMSKAVEGSQWAPHINSEGCEGPIGIIERSRGPNKTPIWRKAGQWSWEHCWW